MPRDGARGLRAVTIRWPLGGEAATARRDGGTGADCR
jgi:hypothetical protein